MQIVYTLSRLFTFAEAVMSLVCAHAEDTPPQQQRTAPMKEDNEYSLSLVLQHF